MAFGSHSTRPATFWVRRKSGWNTGGGSGWSRAITRSSPTSRAPFEPIRCHLFISECTFGLPIYRWESQKDIFTEVAAWWRSNRASGRASLLYAYSLGKAQRILAGLAEIVREQEGWPGSVYTHGAVEVMNQAYRAQAVDLPATTYVAEAAPAVDWSTALIVAPPSAQGTPWARRFGPASSAFASGWMRTEARDGAGPSIADLSSPTTPTGRDCSTSIDATGAETVWLTHGYTSVVTRWLREQGKDAHPVATRYEGESDAATETVAIPSDLTSARRTVRAGLK